MRKLKLIARHLLRQKKQEGNYFDTFIKLSLDYDKRNQKFKTSDGFRSILFLDIPVISDNNSKLILMFSHNIMNFMRIILQNFLFMENQLILLTNDDVKLSERVYLPSSRLRGFESGKVGPKDGNDFIGGNYATSLNISSTLPQIFPNAQNLDVSMFLDAGNVWGVDYDSSLDDTNKIRSSVGLGVDWFTPIGPLSFSLTHPITKADTDKTETFKFNLGTTF